MYVAVTLTINPTFMPLSVSYFYAFAAYVTYYNLIANGLNDVVRKICIFELKIGYNSIRITDTSQILVPR